MRRIPEGFPGFSGSWLKLLYFEGLVFGLKLLCYKLPHPAPPSSLVLALFWDGICEYH